MSTWTDWLLYPAVSTRLWCWCCWGSGLIPVTRILIIIILSKNNVTIHFLLSKLFRCLLFIWEERERIRATEWERWIACSSWSMNCFSTCCCSCSYCYCYPSVWNLQSLCVVLWNWLYMALFTMVRRYTHASCPSWIVEWILYRSVMVNFNVAGGLYYGHVLI